MPPMVKRSLEEQLYTRILYNSFQSSKVDRSTAVTQQSWVNVGRKFWCYTRIIRKTFNDSKATAPRQLFSRHLLPICRLFTRGLHSFASLNVDLIGRYPGFSFLGLGY